MNFEQWAEETANKPPSPFSPKGANQQNLAAVAKPSWQHLSAHGQVAWICAFFNQLPVSK